MVNYRNKEAQETIDDYIKSRNSGSSYAPKESNSKAVDAIDSYIQERERNNNLTIRKAENQRIDFSSQFDSDVLKSVGDKFKSQWGDKYYYDMFDSEDFLRSQTGTMPKYLEKYYDLNDPVDQWLYQNNLPYRDVFSDMYSEYANEHNAAVAEENAYQREYADFRNELYKQLDAVRIGGGDYVDAFENAIVGVFGSGKYNNVAQHFTGYDTEEMPEEGTYGRFEFDRKQNKKEPDQRAFTPETLLKEYEDLVKKSEAAAKAQVLAEGTDSEKLGLEIYEKTEEQAGLESQIKTVEEQLSQAKRRARGKDTPEITSLQAQLDALKAQSSQLQIDLDAANTEYENARLREIDTTDMTVPDIEKRIAENEAKMRELLPTYVPLTAGVTPRTAEGKAEYTALQAENEQLRQQLAEIGYTSRDLERAKAVQTIEAYAAQQLPEGDWSSSANGYWNANAKNKDKDVRSEIAGLVGAVYVANGAEDQIPEALKPNLEGTNFVEEMRELFQYAKPEEVQLFNRIVASNEEDALAFYEAFTDELKFRAVDARDAEAEAFANEHAGAASVKSVFGQFPAALESVGNLIGGTFSEQLGIDPVDVMYNSEHTRRANTYTETVANRIASGTDKESTGKVLSFLYQTAMSMAQTGARMPLGGAGLAVAGLNAASSTMNSVLDQGGTLSQATWLGAVAGTAEAVTEKVSLESLLTAKARGTIGGILKESLKQSLIEGSEETAAEIINMIADELTRASESDLRKEVAELVAGGMSEREALINVIVNRVGGAFLGGALSGFLFGAGGQVMRIATTEGSGFRNKAQTVETLYQEVGGIAPELSKQFAEDVNAMGLSSADTQFLIETFDGVIENYTVLATQQGRDIVDNLTNTMHALANKVSEQTSRDAAKQQRVINKQTKMYESILSAQQEAHAALESGDLTAHRKAAAKYRAAMQEYMRTVEVDNYEKDADRAAKAQRDEKNAQDARKVAAETRQRVAEMAEIAAAEIEADNAVQQAAFERGTSQAQVRNALGDDIVSQMVAMQAQLAAEEGYDPLESNETFDEFSQDQMLEDMAVALKTGDLDLFNATDEQYNELYRDFDLVDEMVNGGRKNEIVQTEGETDGERTDLSDSRTERVLGGYAERENRADDYGSRGTEGDRGGKSVSRQDRGTQSAESEVRWSEQQNDDVQGAVAQINQKYGTAYNAANVREAKNRSERSIEISKQIAGVTGRSSFFVEGDVPFGGLTINKRQYVKYTGDETVDAFNEAHENAHNMPVILAAVFRALDSNAIPKSEYNKYLDKRYDRIAARNSISVEEARNAETPQQARTEFACDMFGCYLAKLFAGKDYFEDQGISRDTARVISAAFADALSEDAYGDIDPDSAEYKAELAIEAGAAITAEGASGKVQFSENYHSTIENAVRKRRLDDINSEIYNDLEQISGINLAAAYSISIRRVREMLNGTFASSLFSFDGKTLYRIWFDTDGHAHVDTNFATRNTILDEVSSYVDYSRQTSFGSTYDNRSRHYQHGGDSELFGRERNHRDSDRLDRGEPTEERSVNPQRISRFDYLTRKEYTSEDLDQAFRALGFGRYNETEDADSALLDVATAYLDRERESSNDGSFLFSENAPMTKKEKLKRATELFADGYTAESLYESDPKNYDPTVGKMLNGIRRRNGEDVGGHLSEQKMEKVLGIFSNAKEQRKIALTLSSPVRVWENVTGWGGKTAAERARNIENGNFIKNTYYEYANQQAAAREVWMAQSRQPILDAIENNGEFGQFESAITQVFGEKMASESQAATAVFDGKTMIVEVLDGVFVLDNRGRLLYTSDSKSYTEYTQPTKDKLKNIPDKGIGNALKDERVPHKYPLIVDRNGNSVTVRDSANGRIVARVVNGKNPNMKAVKATADALRAFYENAHRDMTNVLIQNGYNPPPYIENYFPHLGKSYSGVEGFVQKLSDQNLPTAINGITGMFSPGQPWNPNLQTRLGEKTEFDAIRGFNGYVKHAGDTIFHTPVVQRYRQLEKALRVQGEVAETLEGKTLNSSSVAWVHEQANEWANKKSNLDRDVEEFFGREGYTVSGILTSWFSKASVGGNVRSAMSNIIGGLTGLAQVDGKYAVTETAKAIGQLLQLQGDRIRKTQNYDGFADRIPFMQRRFSDYEDIQIRFADKLQRGGDKALYFLFSAVDRISVESVARAKYAECLAQGMTDIEAVAATNDLLIKNFSDRGKGQAARAFNIKALKPVVQFQAEVLNQMSHGRDMSRAEAERKLLELKKQYGNDIPFDKLDKAALSGGGTRKLRKMMLYAVLLSLYGMLTRELFGYDQTWNPYGMVKDAVTDYKEGGIEKAWEGAWETTKSNLPFASVFGENGRVPLFGGLKDAASAITGLATGDSTVEDALVGASAFVPGGGQLRRSITGIRDAQRGGKYNRNGQLQYPISDEDFWKTAVFGSSAAQPDGYDWQTDTLSEKETAAYHTMVGEGMDEETVYDIMLSYGGSNKAQKALSVAEYADDLTDDEFDLMLEVLDIDYNGSRDDYVEWSIEQGEKSLEQSRKKYEKGDLKKETLDDYEALYDEYFRLLGMTN